MKICIAIDERPLLFLEVDPEATIEGVKLHIECESGIPAAQQILTFQGKTLMNAEFIVAAGVLADDVLVVELADPRIRQQAQQLLNKFRANPRAYFELSYSHPMLAQALQAQNLEMLEQILRSNKQSRRQQAEQQTRLSSADPFDLEAQKLIEQQIQRANIDENFHNAVEFTPEVFGNIEMLYIDCTVNKVPLQAFVDSGAQMTIISQPCAERVGLMRLCDKRYHGVAVGVGQAKIIGRIHAAPLEIGGQFFNCSFTVLGRDDIDIIFGLDMLKRHYCCIDLHRNSLTLSSGAIQVPFLAERDITRKIRRQPSVETDDEAKVAQLVSLGFDRASAQRVLKECGGDAELAASLLFQGGLG
jgi:DNA damage-inducible protein 1